MNEEPRRRISRRPRGEDVLADIAILQRTLNRLRGGALVPKGVYRFARHEEADEWMVRLCRSLNREGVRYLLIGGWAVILHGSVRTTKDIDLLVDPAAANVQAIRRALADLPDNAARELGDAEVAEYGVVRVADEVVVDLMAAACGVTFEQAVAEGGSDQVVVEGVPIAVASKELLVRTKQTVRPSDAADVLYLRALMAEEHSRRDAGD
jgi:Nucleotidyl transferase of unknown function (DUF2204)